jgi:alanyl aminopeptidase
MGADSLVSARAIRQPITSTHDIENAFDSITYQKGGGVLSMFEKWAGADVWQKGLHAYLEKHEFGSGSADDFLTAESEATGKDVKTAFHTFLDQSGVPLVEVSLECGKTSALHLSQSRFLPIGSTGSTDRTWQIPICARFASGKGTKEACTLMTEKTATLDLGAASCPSWVLPNADAAGYYRFSLAPKDLTNLRKNGFASLSIREKVAYATSVRAGYSRATTPMNDVFDAVALLAKETDPAVAEEPMGYVSVAREWLFSDPLRAKVEAYGKELYASQGRKLGWEAKKDEDDEARTLRASVLGFLANTARDKAVRDEAKKRGLAYIGFGGDGAIHTGAVDANLAALALSVVGEDADRATWDAMKALLGKTVDEVVRGRLLWALSSAKSPELAAAARELVLDPSLHESEIMTPLYAQLGAVETRDAAWQWLKDHYDAVVQRLPRHHSGVALVSSTRPYCDDEHAKDIEAFFTPKIDSIEGGPRTLASTLEDIRLCAARRKAQEPSAREFFGKRR